MRKDVAVPTPVDNAVDDAKLRHLINERQSFEATGLQPERSFPASSSRACGPEPDTVRRDYSVNR